MTSANHKKQFNAIDKLSFPSLTPFVIFQVIFLLDKMRRQVEEE